MYRDQLPELARHTLLTDGGLETTLLFHEGFDLPLFASYPLLRDARGQAALLRYFHRYAGIADQQGVGILLETPTWRANADWGARLGDDAEALRRIQHDAVALLEEVRDAFPSIPVVISGNLGPRGDGYVAGDKMSPDEAREYHRAQIQALNESKADLVSLLTATYVEEAIGVIEAARAEEVPVVVSFTVEIDGRLPSGQPLGEAVLEADRATERYPLWYGINCAHPDHFEPVLTSGGAWVDRVRLLRANASRMSHEELDAAEHLDDGDPAELAGSYASLRSRFPSLRILGGCCGTDHRHVSAIGHACVPAATTL